MSVPHKNLYHLGVLSTKFRPQWDLRVLCIRDQPDLYSGLQHTYILLILIFQWDQMLKLLMS